MAPLHSRLPTADRHALIQGKLQGLLGRASVFDIIVGTQDLMGQAHTMNLVRHVIIPSPAWLPHKEEQCLSRNRRVGQKQETHAVRLIARDTIDVTLKRRHEQRSLFDDRVFGFDMVDDEDMRRRVAEAYGIQHMSSQS